MAKSKKEKASVVKKKRKLQLPKLSRKMMIIVGGIAIGIVLIAGVLIWMFMGKSDSGTEQAQNATKTVEEKKPEEGSKTAIKPPVKIEYGIDDTFPNIFLLEPFTNIELQDTNPKRYINTKICLEMSNTETGNEIKKQLPKIRQDIESLFTSRNSIDLFGMEKKLRLKFDLMKKINETLNQGKIRNIYFTEFSIYVLDQ
ncbi:MAG: flagellar basal body-associated FliL family protein [Desulfobacterales bacterium]|nr:flagellar basal body-associated FliL family protein [Desulfobacterales bacterium]